MITRVLVGFGDDPSGRVGDAQVQNFALHYQLVQ